MLAVCGLTKEAGIAAGPGILAIAGGGSRAALEGRLAAVDPAQVAAVVSFGIAGALDPSLRVGDVVLATAVVGEADTFPCAALVRESWVQRLRSNGVATVETRIAGSDVPLLNVADKAALHSRTGAAAVDMESHVAASYAASHDLPFGAIRIISDDARHSLPAAAAVAMRPDGSVDVIAVLRSLMRQPAQIPALVATARDAGVAFRQLRRVRGLLGESGSLLGFRGGLLGLNV